MLEKIKEYVSPLRHLKYGSLSKYSTIGKYSKRTDTICVLGNGPSLNKSVSLYKDYIKNHDCVVVNFFVKSELYELLQPNLYLFADPGFWCPLDKCADWQREEMVDLLELINKKTKWNITIILPNKAMGSYFVNELNKNAYISILFYNTIQFAYPRTLEKKYMCWDKNIIQPPAQTVMNTALYLSIFWKYKTIYTFGIDSTFFQSLEVDQSDNLVYNKDTHFYGNRRIPWYIDTEGKKIGKLHEVAKLFTKIFELYWEIRDYADYKNVKIYNASEFSMVDAFERRKPEEL